MRGAAWLSICAAIMVGLGCGGAKPKQAPLPASVPPTVEPLVEAAPTSLLENSSLAAIQTSIYSASSGGDKDKDSLTPWARRDLDVTTVIGLVKERLGKVAILAVADTLAKLSDKAPRPWARDLLQLTSELAKGTSTDWRLLAERSLRVVARAVLADALARTAMAREDEATREVWADWAYWALAQTTLIADVAARRPAITLSDQAMSELRARVSLMLEGLRQFGRLREEATRRGATPHEFLEQLVSANTLGSLKELHEQAEALRAALEKYRGLNERLAAIGRWKSGLANEVKSPIALDNASANKAAVFAKKLRQGLDDEITIAASKLSARQWADKLATPTVRDAMAALYAELSCDSSKCEFDYSRLYDALQALPVLPLLHPDQLLLPRTLEELSGLLAPANQPRKLDDFTVEDASALVSLSATAISQLDNSAASLKRISPELGEQLSTVSSSLSGLKALIVQLQKLVSSGKGATLGEVQKALHSLRSSVGAEFNAPVLDVLGPVVHKLADGRRITAADLYLAVTQLGPTDLMRALKLPLGDAGGAKLGDCSGNEPWRCWTSRLVLSLHGALEVEGDSVSVQPDELVQGMMKLGASSREQQRGSFHLLASVGIGSLYADGRWRPLIAEQLGGTLLVRSDPKLAFSAGGYVSGVLYRLVLDDEISNGMMFGLTARLRLYDMVELHADLTGVLEYSKEESIVHPGFVIGLQVPLGDYLERATE